MIADQHFDIAMLPSKPQANFAPVAELPADIQTDLRGGGSIFRGNIAIFIVVSQVSDKIARIGRDKIAERIINGLIKLRKKTRALADAHFGAPFARQPVYGRFRKLSGQSRNCWSL